MKPPQHGRTLPWQDRRHRRRAAVRGGLASALCAMTAVLLLDATWTAWATARVQPQPVDAVQVSALGLATLAAVWLTLLVASATASVLPGVLGSWGRRFGALVAPGPCLRIAALLLGTGLVTTAGSAPALALPTPAVTPATAAVTVASGGTSGTSDTALGALPDPSFRSADPTATSEPFVSAASADDCLPRPGWRPARAEVRRETSEVSLVSGCPADAAPTDASRLVVHRGDSLWWIAARALGPEATASEIARAWPRWYAANRHVIGDDPDLLLPGQVLTAPQEVQ